MAKIITFLNNKGGVAKTTSSFNCSMIWAMAGYRVLLIDLDSQGNLTRYASSGVAEHNHPYWDETITENLVSPTLELSIKHSRHPNLDFVPANLRLSKYEVLLSDKPLKDLLLKSALSKVKDDYDFIVIDCPPALGNIIYASLFASDYMVIVTDPALDSFNGTEMIIDAYRTTVGQYSLPLKFIGVLVTCFQNDKINRKAFDCIKRAYGSYVIEPLIHKATVIPQAGEYGLSIVEYKPECRAAKEYKDAAASILARILDYERK